jgi:hypothetical protein
MNPVYDLGVFGTITGFFSTHYSAATYNIYEFNLIACEKVMSAV